MDTHKSEFEDCLLQCSMRTSNVKENAIFVLCQICNRHTLDKAPRLSISIVIWILSSNTICQLNQFHTNREAAMLSNPGPPSTVVLYFPNCEWSTWEERGSYIFSKKKRLLNLFTAHLKGLKQHQYQPKKECWRQCWQLFHLNIYTKHDLSFNERQF